MKVMARRTPETLADYLVVAITPALIGLMVGSLLWFLIEVFYGGDFRTLWVSSFFVLGIVGVSRIAIEEGYHRAQLFGFVLAAALGFVLPPKAWPLLALIWWSVHKLTWDCTVIDDDQDASGEGLLQTMGLDSGGGQSKTPPGTTVTADQLEATTSKEPTAEKYWWDRLFEPDRRPHAPGVWVVYFSLAALPLFGIGGWFVTDPETTPVCDGSTATRASPESGASRPVALGTGAGADASSILSSFSGGAQSQPSDLAVRHAPGSLDTGARPALRYRASSSLSCTALRESDGAASQNAPA